MQRRHGNALTDGHGSDIRLIHHLRVVQNAILFARQLYAGCSAKAELFAVIDHPLRAQLHTQLYHTRIDRIFDNVLKRHQPHALAVPVADGAVGDLDAARIVDHGRRCNDFLRQSHNAHDGLKDRARFVDR